MFKPFQRSLVITAQPALTPETVDWIRRVGVNGGSVSASTTGAVDAFVRRLKITGLWAKTLDMGVFAGTGLGAALTKLKYIAAAGASLVNVSFVAGDYVETGASAGILNDGTTKRFRSGVMPSMIGATGHISAYLRESLVAGGYPGIVGTGDGTDTFLLSQNNTTIAFYWGLGTVANNAAITAGFYCGTRNSGTDLKISRNGVVGASVTTATTPNLIANEMVVCGKKNISTLSSYAAKRMSFYSIGAALSDTDHAHLYAAVQALQTALGRNV